MSTLFLEAEIRTDKGKGASRRLRRLEEKVPAILYGGDKDPMLLYLLHRKVVKALETESIYSSMFDLKINGKSEKVLLKDIQHHPFKPYIMHMDFQRVSGKDVLVRMVPLHFINEETAKGVKEGGLLSRNVNQVEIRCKASDLPEYIEVDVADMAMNEMLHLSELKMPKNVELAIDPTEGDHNHLVVSIHQPKAHSEPEEEAAQAEGNAEDTGSEESK